MKKKIMNTIYMKTPEDKLFGLFKQTINNFEYLEKSASSCEAASRRKMSENSIKK